MKNFLAEKQGVILRLFLAFIFVLFIGILVMAYFVSKRANPILLDEKGRPVNAESQSKH
jgi:hypothetical protein